MSWEIITAIATALTVLVAFGVPFMINILSKAKVSIPKILDIHWLYDYHNTDENGKMIELRGLKIWCKFRLVNKGENRTTIDIWFESVDGKRFILEPSEPIKVEANTIFKDEYAELKYSTQSEFLPKGYVLKGKLTFEPCGNRRFLFGKKYLKQYVDIPDGNRTSIKYPEKVNN